MKLNFMRKGSGRPLVLLHGLFESSLSWFTVFESLSSVFDVIAPDLRNHGGSPHHNSASVDDMAADLVEFFDDLKIRDSLLLGHSMGGRVAMRLALDHPKLIEKLLIEDMAPREFPPLWAFEILRSLDFHAIQNLRDADRILSSAIPHPILRSSLLANITVDRNGQFYWKMNFKALDEGSLGLRQEITSGNAFAGPVLFLRGGDSENLSHKDFGQIMKLFPNATIETMEGGGHWLHVEKPDEFIRWVVRFFGPEDRTGRGLEPPQAP
jgi:esterase